MSLAEINQMSDCVMQEESPYFFSSGRSAIMAVIQLTDAATKKIALPYFTCHSVIEPFVKKGCEIVFYAVEEDLRVNEKYLVQFCNEEQPYLLFYHDYFGLNDSNRWENIYSQLHNHLIFVNDQTHSFFSAQKNLSSHFSLMSIRKWGGISEGGILSIHFSNERKVIYEERSKQDKRLENYKQASLAKRLYLNGDTSVNKEDFRAMFYLSESFFDAENGVYPIHRNGISSWNALLRTDFIDKRRSNFGVLENGWKLDWTDWGKPIIKYSNGMTPLYFPILLGVNRKRFQDFLAAEKIYAPIIWPKSSLIEIQGNDIFYNQLICIPIDQRYSEVEMSHVLRVIAAFDESLKDERN